MPVADFFIPKSTSLQKQKPTSFSLDSQDNLLASANWGWWFLSLILVARVEAEVDIEVEVAVTGGVPLYGKVP